MLTIATIVPNDYFAPWDFVRSILNLPPKYFFKTAQSCSLANNRNLIFEMMRMDGGNLLFIDSDTVFEPEDVATIESNLRIYDIITGLYMLLDGNPAILERVAGDYKFTPIREGIFEIGACGAGFLGISEKVIAKMPPEPFHPVTEEDKTHGDDISFCHRAREQGFKIWCDSSVKVGHIKTKIIRIGDEIEKIY